MTEKFEVFNPHAQAVSLSLNPPSEIPEGTPKHKQRKLIRAGLVHVLILPHHSLDLVAHTGMSLAELKMQPELLKMLKAPIPRLTVLGASNLPEEPKVKTETAEAAPVEEVQAESEEEKDEAETPKKKKKARKK